MSCFECCCPGWCRRKSGSQEESEPLITRKDVGDSIIKEKFRKFRKIVLENSLKDFDEVTEDIRDITILLSPVGVGGVDAQMLGYATLYNDHLERWKNLKYQINEYKKMPAITERSRVTTFRSALTHLHNICDDIQNANGDLRVNALSEFCLMIEYKPSWENEENNERVLAISCFNQISRELREFLERGPSLARLLKSVAGGVRFQDEIIPKKTADQSKTDKKDEVVKDSDEEEKKETPKETTDPLSQRDADDKPTAANYAGTPPSKSMERANLDSSISNAGLSKEKEEVVMKKYKFNLELLGRGAASVEVLDLAAKSLWQNIHDELSNDT